MKLMTNLDNIASGKEIFIFKNMISLVNFSTLGIVLLIISRDAGCFDPEVEMKVELVL